MRKLAAILVADVAGYSRLMEARETATLEAFRAHRREVLDPRIARYNGRVFKLAGDGLFAEFASAVEAVECALEIQAAMAERNAGEPADRRIELRIAVHLGDIILEDDDVHGDGVNVAARLQALAPVGGVVVSDRVHDMVHPRIDTPFQDQGGQRLKNITAPVRTWAFVPGASEEPAPSQRPGAVHEKPAIAVLPFDNMSDDPEQTYFSDGLTEELITALAQWHSFWVIARNSSFAYKGKAMRVPEIARELGADYVLEGSVRKAGARVRVTVQLIEGASGHHLWAHRHDRELADIFDLQDELTQGIAAFLAPELNRAQLRRVASKRPGDLRAWDCCLRGEAALAKDTAAGNREARAHFDQAIDIDPDYADAHAGLAQSHNRDLLLRCTDDADASRRRALEIAKRAVQLDPDSARAHHVLGTAYIWNGLHDDALEEARLAVQLNPNDPIGLHMLGNKSDLAGDPQGIAHMERAQRLNPQDPDAHIHKCFLARAYINAGRDDTAVGIARAAVRRRPDYPGAHFILAIALACVGRLEDARAELASSERLSPGFVAERTDWRPYTNPDSNLRFQEILRRIGLDTAGD